ALGSHRRVAHVQSDAEARNQRSSRAVRVPGVTNIIRHDRYPAASMAMRETDEPRSRRDRPAKPPLSRAVITAAALELVRQGSLDPVTRREGADRLDTGPASLY